MNIHSFILSLMLFCGSQPPGLLLNGSDGRPRALPQDIRQGAKGGGGKEKTAAAEETLEAGSVKGQAVEALREVIEQSTSINEPDERALVVSNAAELLWRYDKDQARAGISSLLDNLIEQFKKKSQASEQAGAEAQKITASINTLLKVLARRDPVSAEQALAGFQSLREEAIKNSPPNLILSERFALAKESIDINIRQSADLAARVIEQRVPSTFPQYLYDLKKRDAAVADALYRKALTTLASAQAYNVSEATLLSTYAFGERMVLLPMPAPKSDQGKGLEFGVFTVPLTSPPQGAEQALANEYLGAAYSFIAAKVAPGSSQAADSAFLGRSFFLVRKLHVYAAGLGGDRQSRWQQLEHSVGNLARNAGLDQTTLDHLGGYAQRLAINSNVFQFDGGASAFERASKTEDREKRAGLIAAGVWSLIQEQKFVEAENRLKEVETPTLRDRLSDLLNYSAGLAAVGKRDWNETALRAAKVKDAEIRLLLFLAGARSSVGGRGGNRTFALQYLGEALTIIPKLENGERRAKGLVVAASLLSSIDRRWGNEVLLKAKDEINRAESYDRGSFELDVELPGVAVPVVLADSTLEACFKRLGETDWAGVQDAVKELKSPTVRSLALIAASHAVL